MAVFEYKALNSKGRKVSGIIEADSVNTARIKLKSRDIFPLSITSIVEKSKAAEKGPYLFSRIRASDVAMTTRQLSALISSGLPLVRSISTLAAQARSGALKKVLSSVQHSVEEGSSFADALSQHPSVFSPIYVNMVRAGESSGTLEIVLQRLADITEKREDTKKKIQAALAYPILMAVVGTAVLVFLLTYIVPEIVGIFADMNQALPLPTRLLISASTFLKSFWWVIGLLCLAGAGLIYILRKTDRGALIMDTLLLRLPFAGELVRKMIAARFSSTLASLLNNGVPILTALRITNSVTGNTIVSHLIHEAAITVEQGGELGEVLEKSRYFPRLAAQMITVGERSGELETMLEKTSDLFEKEVESAVSTAASLLEPMIILLMGIVLGFIILSICLPIFEINQLIR